MYRRAGEAQRHYMKWEQGRQGTGYKKLKLFQIGNKLLGGMDLYLLRYDVGDSIPSHVDPVDGKRHFRVNFELKRARIGGELYVDEPILRFWRLSVFRSDKSKHAVHLVEKGTRFVVSLGVAI
jgi:hypothetical protein